MILESNSSKDAKVNSLFSLLLFASLLPLLDEIYVIASSRFSCVSSPGFPAGVLAHFIINCSLFIVAFWLRTDIPLRWVLYQRCQNAPCSLPGQNMRQESGCEEGEHRAADSGADSLTRVSCGCHKAKRNSNRAPNRNRNLLCHVDRVPSECCLVWKRHKGGWLLCLIVAGTEVKVNTFMA